MAETALMTAESALIMAETALIMAETALIYFNKFQILEVAFTSVLAETALVMAESAAIMASDLQACSGQCLKVEGQCVGIFIFCVMPKTKVSGKQMPVRKRSKASTDTVVESQSVESSVQLEESSKVTNLLAVNLGDGNEIQLVTAVEGSEKEKAVLAEVRNEFSSEDTASGENQGLFSSLVSDGNTSENNPIPCDATNGQKRFLDANENAKFLYAPNYVSYTDYMVLKNQYDGLESRVIKLENERMPQPQHPTTVKHFTNTSNTLRGTQEDTIVDKDSLMLKMKQLLGLDEKQLVEYHEKTSKATARCLIKFLYPNPEPNLTYSNVKKSVINSIISYTKLSNPYDTASDAEIRKSINNYFTSLPRKTKMKTVPITNQVSEESKKNDNVVSN
ncbi:unnamed protein product [Rotaria magnacalcarata]|uniref:BEN domain-containing protein n=1 Tax=Rotaria magnacalcarata TaxID=392030 RepID=A0A816V268_9BILA|nr:unnamed protein product [Rotaria magnacalcarata]